MKMTKQGVRDLNGPNMDGKGYSGRRGKYVIVCSHFWGLVRVPVGWDAYELRERCLVCKEVR